MVEINGKLIWLPEHGRYCLFLVKRDGTRSKIIDPLYDEE